MKCTHRFAVYYNSQSFENYPFSTCRKPVTQSKTSLTAIIISCVQCLHMCKVANIIHSNTKTTCEYLNGVNIHCSPNILYINICYSVLNNSQISEMTWNISDSQAQYFTHRTNLEGMVIINCPRRDRQLIIIIESWIYTCMFRKSEFRSCYY